MCCLYVGHAKPHPLSHCLLPWYDAFVLWFFSSTTFDTLFSLATIIAYDLLHRAFSIIIFSLCSINRSSFAFCWWICFSLKSFGIFSFLFLCFPCALLVNFLCAASAQCLGWDLFKSIKTATTGSTALLMWAPELSLPDNNTPQSMGCFLSAEGWPSPALQPGTADASWEPPWAARTNTNSNKHHLWEPLQPWTPLNLLLLGLGWGIALKMWEPLSGAAQMYTSS